ncbi:MAG: nucleotidyltransferase [Anaerolineae bacterium]|nr:nucleotidyltransferase [Anaerolineae bacterium]
MNDLCKPYGLLGTARSIPLISIGERLLAATAIKIELPPSQHRIAVGRKNALEKHLERDGSPLKGLIQIFYQQGSMAIGATIKAKYRDEGFDIDIVVEMMVEPSIQPDYALDLLYIAVRGEPGSRYFDFTQRQTRCVTVHYADGMHLDLTPAILLDEHDPRFSSIFHSKPEEPRSSDQRIPTNSYAFADEYNQRCPVDHLFAEEYKRLVLEADPFSFQVLAEADSVPVPQHSTEVGGKSAVTVALQLLKRNRNIRYYSRQGRIPPSVMLACLTLEVAEPGRTIGESLRVIASHILGKMEQAKALGQLIRVVNPRCVSDCFTDRWPENFKAQDIYINDLRLFVTQLERFLDESQPLQKRVKALEAMFGESPTREVVKEFTEEIGQTVQSGNHGHTASGSVLPVASALPSAHRKARPNTFFGTPWPENQNR